MSRGAPSKKTPLPVVLLRRGCQRRAARTSSHTARLRAGRRIHCSAPLTRAAARQIILPRSLRLHVPYVFLYVTQPLDVKSSWIIFNHDYHL